jgi:uncharacterized protein with von Willebrand factor type A (vWA) domain
VNELPLLELFNNLQKPLRLGLDDYQAVLKSLQGGYGLADQEALARLCRILWVRSPDERLLFDYYFQQIFQAELLKNTKAESVQSTTKPNYCKKLLIGSISIIAGSLCQLEHPRQSQVASGQSSTPSHLVSVTSSPVPSANHPLLERRDSQPNSLIWIALMLTFAGLGVLGIRLLQQHRLRSSNSSKPKPRVSPEVILDLEDEIQVAQTVRQLNKTIKRSYDFIMQVDFLPVTQREMKQSWRYLRQPIRQGVAKHLDLEATIEHIAQYGALLKPVLIPPKVNRTELVLLIDSEGSMIAFRSLSDRLIETALRGGRLGKTHIYYFHNCPLGYLYRDSCHVQAETVQDVLNQFKRDRTVVLFFSDAGAARGAHNLERLAATEKFLKLLNQKVKRMAWINPMPKSRWTRTTAAEIARSVPMFEATRQGLDCAISALRGRHYSTSKLRENE